MPRSSLHSTTIRATMVAATTAAALLAAVPAGAPTAPAGLHSTPPAGGLTTNPGAAPATDLITTAAPPPMHAGTLFPPPAAAVPAPAPAPVPTVEVPVEQVASATPTATRSGAMSRALSKVGSPYRWGAAGPNAFDCSGLVTWAYKGTGVSLPRSSRAMSQVGTPVSKGELRPGDLVFFYRPVSHVGIYIGNGKIVHASSKKSPVKVSDMGRMKFNSARRV